MGPIVILIVGLILGVALTLGLGVMVMRSQMVVAHRCGQSFEATCATIEKIIPETEGWSLPLGSWNAHEVLAAKNLAPANIKHLQFYFLCKGKAANRLLTAVPSMAGMMPCSWAVYELQEGGVYVSGMNIGMMSRMFGGTPGSVMQEIARADEGFLAQLKG